MTFYQITCDDKILYDIRSKDRIVLNPILTLEIGKNGSLSFIIPPSNPCYSMIQLKTSIIKVYQITKKNGRFYSERLFRGTAYSNNKDFLKRKQIKCEGELSFFNDSVVRKYEWVGSVENYLKYMVSSHNNQVDEFKQFAVRRVTVVDDNDYIRRANENYPRTKSELDEKLIDYLGGHFEVEEIDGVVYLDYLAEYEKYNSQAIVFGRNLLDLSEFITAENVATRLVGLGVKDDETGEYLKFDDINGGIDYVEDESAIAIWGLCTDTVKFDDVTVKENLLNKTRKALQDRIASESTIEMTAADLHAIDVNIEAFRVGRWTRVISIPHDFDKWFLLSKMTLYLDDIKSSEIVLGATFKTLTQKQIEQERQNRKDNSNALVVANSAVNTANSARTVANSANSVAVVAKETADEAKSTADTSNEKIDNFIITVPQTYIDNAALESFKNEVNQKIASVYKICGSVSSFSILQNLQNKSIGDVYNVLDTGANYVWTGEEWDKLSETIDLSLYLKTTVAENTYAKKNALNEYLKLEDAEETYATIEQLNDLIERIEGLENNDGGVE